MTTEPEPAITPLPDVASSTPKSPYANAWACSRSRWLSSR